MGTCVVAQGEEFVTTGVVQSYTVRHDYAERRCVWEFDFADSWSARPHAPAGDPAAKFERGIFALTVDGEAVSPNTL
jgi:hypothetical protein